MMLGIDKWRRIGLKVTRGLAGTALILMYHRVADVVSDPWSLCVNPQHFDEHLQVLRNHVVPLSTLNAAHRKMRLHGRKFIITFDDGYSDNLHNAKPLLERWDVSATVFMVAGNIGSEREFWWDQLERLILQPGRLPETLQLSIDSRDYRWELGDAARCCEASNHLHDAGLSSSDTSKSRLRLYRTIWELLRPLSINERTEILGQLEGWAGVDSSARSSHRSLSLEDLHSMAHGGLIEIGAHSFTHQDLAGLSMPLQQEEIYQSKLYLESVLGRRVAAFSYPYGSYTEETLSLVHDAGFGCACSATTGIVTPHTDPFRLPRFHVQDWDGEQFEKQLFRWISS